MTFQAIGYLWAALGGAAIVLALHFLARRRPRPVVLPTARFVPERTVRAPALHRRPSDRVVLGLRMSAVLLVGIAFARPTSPERRPPVAHLTIGDSVPSFSAAFAAALRFAASPRADSVALTLAMPLTQDRWDAAAPSWRALWPGRVRLVHAETRRNGAEARVNVMVGVVDDSVRAVVVRDVAVVGRFVRAVVPEGVPVAFWNDGTAAAVEVVTDGGCVRHVGFSAPVGDLALRPAYRRIEERMRRPCGEVLADTTPLDPAQIALLEGTGGPAAVADLPPSRLPVRPPWPLLALGALALGAEQMLRRRPA